MAIYKCAGRNRSDHEGQPICTHEAEAPWPGRCPSCHNRFNCDKVGSERRRKEPERLTTASDVPEIKRIPTGNAHFDDVIGGGIVDGAVILLGGIRGQGKTTLVVQLADSFTQTNDETMLIASGEESGVNVVQTAMRIGVKNDRIAVMGEAYDLDAVLDRVLAIRARFFAVDSLQAITQGTGIEAGGATQRAIQASAMIGRFCEKHNRIALVINHMTRANEFAGSTTIEHFVKALLMFMPYNEKDDGRLSSCIPRNEAAVVNPEDVRVLMGAGKNRLGRANEKRFFEMTREGTLRMISKKQRVIVQSVGIDAED